MENKEKRIVIKAEKPFLAKGFMKGDSVIRPKNMDKNHVERIEAVIEKGKIEEISCKEIEEGREVDVHVFNRNGDPFHFRTMLYELLDILDEESQKQFAMYLNPQEVEYYLGKYARPHMFFVRERYKNTVTLWEYTIRILDGKIYEITKKSLRSVSGTQRMSRTTIEKNEYEVKVKLREIVEGLISQQGIKKYQEFLSCLCEEEIERFFKPSYLPR